MLLIDKYQNVLEEHNYDPWDRLRNPVDWSYDGIDTGFIANFGYTGHEMLPELDLINMNFAIKRGQRENIIFSLPGVSKISEANGRMYDPLLGRMLNPDNFVQDPTNFDNYEYKELCRYGKYHGYDKTGYKVESILKNILICMVLEQA